MKIVVDTNRIIAALIKKGTSRDILFDENFEFRTPDYSITEIRKHKDKLIKKIKLTEEEFELLLTLIFEYIIIVPQSEYDEFMSECKDFISDPDDVPFLALCLAGNAQGVWSHDHHFLEQNKFKIFTNIDLLKISGKQNSL